MSAQREDQKGSAQREDQKGNAQREDRIAGDVVVIGPAPPLRGGIAAHTSRLVESFRSCGVLATAVSYRRLYPSMLFPGRSQRSSMPEPPWSSADLDVLDVRTWLRLRRELATSTATIVVQWWHPVVAPALAVATSSVPRHRLVAICHNVLPHENVPGASLAARLVLGRCGRVVCHSRHEQAVARHILGAAEVAGSRAAGEAAQAVSSARFPDIVHAPLPCLVAAGDACRPTAAPELAATAATDRIVVAAGHVRDYKGLPLLVRAWKAARRPDGARLFVVGESYLGRKAAAELSLAASTEPSIIFVDRYVEDSELMFFLMRAEVLVAAHLEASQSGLLPLARALGLRCITSDAGGLAEQLGGGDAGPAAGGEVVRKGDASALARALERCFDAEPAERHSPVRERFLHGWQAVVEAIGAGERP